jgi:hypothetical protein
MRGRDSAIGIGIVLFAVGNLVAIPYQEWAGRAGKPLMAPEYFPELILWALAILGAVLTANALFGTAEARDVSPISSRVLVPILIAVAYAALFEIAGFILTTAAAIVSLAWFLGERRPLLLLVPAIVTPLLIQLGAHYGLHVVLP